VIPPDTRYASIGPDRVAYQVLGEGPRDLVYTWGLWSHLDAPWEDPASARFMRRLASFARLIRFDRRGSGMSDPRPNDGGSIVDHWNEDLIAVIRASGAKAPAILCTMDSGPLVLEFVDRHPEHCSALILAGTTSCMREAPDYPEGHPAGALNRLRDAVIASWGTEEGAAQLAPSQAGNPEFLRWYARMQRSIASPRAVAENIHTIGDIDARHVLPRVRIPTLVIARHNQRLFPPAQSAYLARNIPGARLVELPGTDSNLAWDGTDEAVNLIEEFLTGHRRSEDIERVLATVLFTDIVESTKIATKLGDAAWRELLDRHDRVVREQIELYGGRLVDSAGDGAFATFPTPGSAIDCAHALHEAVKSLKIRLRAGLHIGEVELREDGRVGGIAVHIGARVLGEADPGDVLISRTVRDVLIGSRYRFKERGIRELRGVPSKWPLYVVPPTKKD
jgi:class 3 adenylate cyclase